MFEAGKWLTERWYNKRMDLTIRDETTTGKTVNELVLSGIAARCTLRDLIRTRVREEVARYNAEQGDLFIGLVQPTDAEQELNGWRLRAPRRISWEEQADVAEEAFGRNGFFVLVGDRQVDDLDEELALTADTDVAFVRLTPLVGG
jgi:hypothetical protein